MYQQSYPGSSRAMLSDSLTGKDSPPSGKDYPNDRYSPTCRLFESSGTQEQSSESKIIYKGLWEKPSIL